MIEWLRSIVCDTEPYEPEKDPRITKGIRLGKKIDLLLSIDTERSSVQAQFITDLLKDRFNHDA